MNEKIKGLAQEAGIHFEEGKQSRIHFVSTTTLDQFAELIVKRVIQKCQAHPTWTGRMLGEDIRQYFEVEE